MYLFFEESSERRCLVARKSFTVTDLLQVCYEEVLVSDLIRHHPRALCLGSC